MVHSQISYYLSSHLSLTASHFHLSNRSNGLGQIQPGESLVKEEEMECNSQVRELPLSNVQCQHSGTVSKGLTECPTPGSGLEVFTCKNAFPFCPISYWDDFWQGKTFPGALLRPWIGWHQRTIGGLPASGKAGQLCNGISLDGRENCFIWMKDITLHGASSCTEECVCSITCCTKSDGSSYRSWRTELFEEETWFTKPTP